LASHCLLYLRTSNNPFEMDSDDDFLIADHEDLDTDIKDDLYQGTKSPPPTPARSAPNTPSTNSPSGLTSIPLSFQSASGANPSVYSASGSQNGHDVNLHSHSLPATGDPAPTLVMAPKPLSTQLTTGNAKANAPPQPAAPSTYEMRFEFPFLPPISLSLVLTPMIPFIMVFSV